MKIETKKDRRERIRLRLRKKLAGDAARPRLAVFRSVAHIYVQAIDDCQRHDRGVGEHDRAGHQGPTRRRRAGGNVKGAAAVGRVLAERLKDKGITRVVFDRGGFLYHGRVRAVAEAAREAGLEF